MAAQQRRQEHTRARHPHRLSQPHDEAAFTQPTLESVFLDVAERYDTPADEGAVV